MNQILVYSAFDSERLRYSLQLILEELLGLNWTLTCSLQEAANSALPVISYTNESITKASTIIPHSSFLNSKTIEPIQVSPKTINDTIAFFETNDATLGFDIFAASFYLVSRYEEYLPFTPDQHGRFAATESLACKYNFIDRPLINEWAGLLAKKLKNTFPSLEISQPSYNHIITSDIDSVFSFRSKGLKRTIGGFIQDLLNADFINIKSRFLTITGLKTDPYDVYEQMQTVAIQRKKTIQWFILTANYAAPDNSNNFDYKAVQKKIQQLGNMGIVGIHPSYASNKKTELLHTEIQTLNKIISKKVHHSRQHFLKLHLPDTYQNLIKENITADFSMGFADKPGFRASIASPFYFFNLKGNKTTTLRVYPLVIMDRTFVSYEKSTPNEALAEMIRLRDIVKQNNGTLISLWHNITLANTTEGKRWMNIFKQFIENE